MTRLFSYDEASKPYPTGWGVPREMLVEAVNSGALKAVKRGNNFVRLREAEVDRWIASLERVQ